MADWSGLPEVLLGSIIARLSLSDLIRCSCVCRSWRSIAPPFLQGKKLLPWMIIPCNYENNSPRKRKHAFVWDKILGIISLSDPTRKVYELELPEATDKGIRGSSAGGWLVTVNSNTEVRLIHPFTRVKIQLPPLTAFANSRRFFGIKKAIVGFCSSESDAMVMAIRKEDGILAFCRPGKDLRWSVIQGYRHDRSLDVIFYKWQFFTVTCSGRVFMVSGLQGDASSPHLTLVGRPPLSLFLPDKVYLVESSGELLRVSRYLDWDHYVDDYEDDEDWNEDGTEEAVLLPNKTINFDVFKVDLGGGNLVEVDNLGDRAMFVSCFGSFSVSASEFPGCKRNSIYFTDDFYELCNHCYPQKQEAHDMGVFDLGDGTIEPLVLTNETLSFLSPSLWFSMNPLHRRFRLQHRTYKDV